MSDPSRHNPVDWTELARALGTIHETGESGSSHLANAAIEIIIGPANLRAAVDHYVALKPGFELARHVLWRLHPWCAMERCYEIYQTSNDPQARCSAVKLLRVVADERVLPWIRGFLDDPEEEVQSWGAGVVDQLLFSDLVDPEDCAHLLAVMETHPNEQVRRMHRLIQEHFTSRERLEE